MPLLNCLRRARQLLTLYGVFVIPYLIGKLTFLRAMHREVGHRFRLSTYHSEQKLTNHSGRSRTYEAQWPNRRHRYHSCATTQRCVYNTRQLSLSGGTRGGEAVPLGS
jgi:hypothetical protein